MNEVFNTQTVSPQKIAIDSMERYSGSRINDFGKYLLITNFPKYVEYFAQSRGVKVVEGSTFKVAHSPKEDISILDFKIGSPMAALVIDLCAYLPIKGVMMLGMAGGLRERFEIGDFFVPVGSIRGDGTSDFYFPPEVPALANFVVQRIATEVLEEQGIKYHLGITHTTNRRFWEFNEEFKQHLLVTRPQAIEMECATLFVASYKHKVPLGALLLISDLPLKPTGIKTKDSSEHVFKTFTQKHVEMGVAILKRLEHWQDKNEKGQASEGLLARHDHSEPAKVELLDNKKTTKQKKETLVTASKKKTPKASIIGKTSGKTSPKKQVRRNEKP